MKRLGKNLLLKRAFEPKSWGIAANAGDALDLTGYDRVLYILHVGALGTSATLDVKAQECATSGGTYADITNAVIPQVTEATDQEVYLLDIPVSGAKPFQKLIGTVGTAASIFGATAVPYFADNAPVVQQNTVVYLP